LKILGFSRTVFSLGLVSFFNDAASEMIYPLLPIFLVSIGASMPLIGLIEGIAETTASILKLFSGWFADRTGLKRFLTASGYILSNIARPLIGASGSGMQVLFLRFTDRVGKGIRTAPRDAIIADDTPVREWGKAYGFNRSMDHAGAMAGAFAALVLIKFLGVSIPWIFILSAVPGILAVICVVAGVARVKDTMVSNIGRLKLSLKPFDSRFKLYLVVMAVFTLGNSSDAFLLLRAKEMGIGIADLPLIWIVFHAVKSILSIPGGMLSDKVGRRGLIIAGWAIYAGVYLGFSMAVSQSQIWLLFIVYGAFYGLTEGVEKAFVADMVPVEHRGTAFGIFNFVVGVMALPASLLCGFLWQDFSSMVALGTGSALAILAGIMLVVLVKPVDAKH